MVYIVTEILSLSVRETKMPGHENFFGNDKKFDVKIFSFSSFRGRGFKKLVKGAT